LIDDVFEHDWNSCQGSRLGALGHEIVDVCGPLQGAVGIDQGGRIENSLGFLETLDRLFSQRHG
jgi:hypothetical protein